MIDFNELFRDGQFSFGTVFSSEPHVFGVRYSRGEQSLTVLRAVYKRSELESLPVFQQAQDGEPELLINQWFTKVTPDCVIKFGAKKQLAFVVTFEQASEANFKLVAGYGILGFRTAQLDGKHHYFDELAFANMIQRFNLSIDILRNEHQFNKRQLLLLCKHRYNFETLLERGVSLSDIKHRYFDLLPLSDLESLLSLITLKQISGHSHTPPPVPGDLRFEPFKCSNLGGSAQYPPYSCECKNGRQAIYYRDQPIMTMYMADTATMSTWGAETAELTPESLIHNWYHLPEQRPDSSSMVLRRVYCPELNQGIVTELFPGFSEKQYEAAVRPILFLDTDYEKERQFAEYVKRHKSSLETLRQLPGMTAVKLMILCDNHYSLSQCLKHNMTLSDFAKIDEARMLHVFEHSGSAHDALKLVGASGLFGLKKTEPGRTLLTRFFNPPAPETTIEESSSDDEETSRSVASRSIG